MGREQNLRRRLPASLLIGVNGFLVDLAVLVAILVVRR